MALQGVAQKNDTGCFIASIAMLLGKSYEEAFRLLHPGKDPVTEWRHGFLDESMTRAAFNALERAGIQGHASRLKRFRSYSKKNKHALLIIRWSMFPTLCHTIVYDGDEHKFLDPVDGREPSKGWLKHLETQLEFGIIIDRIPSKVNYDVSRDDFVGAGTERKSPTGSSLFHQD